MGGEDFAFYGAPEHGVKAVFFFVGGTPQAELATVAAHHSPLFKIAPEPSVTTGIEAMVVGALTLGPLAPRTPCRKKPLAPRCVCDCHAYSV